MRFTRTRVGGVKAQVKAAELSVLRQCATELLELLGEPVVHEDPLAAMVGMPPEHVEAPQDAVLARLLPAAYRDDDEAAGEFRRFTDGDLRQAKRTAARTVLSSLPERAGKLVLDRDQADAWLTCLNDVRLAVGTALGVTEQMTEDDFEVDDPRAGAFMVYGWLGWLQESLLSCLEPRPPVS